MNKEDTLTGQIDKATLQYALMENFEGISQEALFCMKRGPDDLWGPWMDYDQFLPFLASRERDRDEKYSFRLETFSAESDHSLGKEGPRWFDSCWEESTSENVTSYSSITVQGTNHETILRPEAGVLDRIFSQAVAN
ncbi:hypothetical protein BDV10DRAFT_178839, partial [Aspergillus recurvatus]